MTVLLQSEFPLWVAVCAWCKPKNPAAFLGNSLGPVSHGICPRHLKKLRQELQKRHGGHPAPATVPRSRRRRAVFDHPQLNYQD